MATSTHNKYVSIPDWFSSSSSTPITSAEKPANITNVYYGGGSGGDTTGITEIPIDNKTIVWLDLVITVPIDNDKIIINTEGKITTSGTTGVWELRQLTDGTNYIYTTYPVVTQLGITMYAGTDGLDLGSIYDGLPIDNATIYWDLDENGNKILKAVGSSGGVADSVAWANVIGKPDWLLDGKVLYTEIEGIPDLSGFITKDYVDGKFVTFGLNETIDGIKTFTNGIKIGTSLINQSLNDIIYIDANLAVRGGITMYAADIIDIPSILDSLPVAGTESKGIASFDSSYFSVTNGKVTLLADNVGLNESELAEYLNTNNYAKKSDIPSLNGYATQSWVESKGYALNSDLMSLTTKVDDFLEGSDTDTIINKWLELEAFLSGLSESDNLATILGNKADKSELTKYIPISGYTEVSGEKNFTGGLKVNGSPIVYDSTKKYWKLEGDLLVTGGVTMYGSDSSFTPSTIMDAILYDSATLGINSNGQLYVKGGAGGGINTTDLQNYLTQNSYLNVTSGDNRYLKLSGGTITGTLAVYENLGVGGTIINKNHYLFARDNANADWIVTNKNWGAEYVLIHSGNIGSYNAGSATKLQTARTIWGQSFDGSGNVSGELALGSSCITGFQGANILDARSSWVILGEGANAKGWTTYINGYNINFRSGSSSGSAMYINSDLNIGVRTTTPSYNFDVNGTLNATTIYQNGTTLANTYLSLSGGTMNGIITMPKNYQIQWGSSSMMIYGEDTNAISIVAPLGLYVNSKEVWHSGNLNPSNYLPLSGGTMTGNISLGGTTTNKIGTNIVDTTGGYQEFTHLNSHGYIAIGPFNGSVAHIYTDRPSFYFNKDLYVNDAKVWHAGNDGSGSGLDADLLDGKHNGELTASMLFSGGGSVLDANEIKFSDYALRFFSTIPNTSTNFPTFTGYQNGLLTLPLHSNGATAQLYFTVGKNPYFRSYHTYDWNELAYKNDNVASATKIQTARTIWGQSFDGTGNVSGNLLGSYFGIYDVSGNPYIKFSSGGATTFIQMLSSGTLCLGKNYSALIVNQDGNVGIGTTNPEYKLHVAGSGYFGSYLSIGTASTAFLSMNRTSANYITTPTSGYMVFCMGGNGTSVSTSNLVLYTHNVAMAMSGGNVGIGTTSPSAKLEVNGITRLLSDLDVKGYLYTSGLVYLGANSDGIYLHATGINFHNSSNGWVASCVTFDGNGNINALHNLLVNGGITMYSDQRKKTILNHVELSLKQIADAPLIEHYYNSDDKKTTHVGSIAQYWAKMNDWFCKLDNEGYYTMEIQNAALASAISIARELDRYETKTDKAIKKLKKIISELEDEVERLKCA